MTTEQGTMRGTIDRINAWKSGKGYFFTIDESDDEFYGFGSCTGKEGFGYKLEFKAGSGKFQDKYELITLTTEIPEDPNVDPTFTNRNALPKPVSPIKAGFSEGRNTSIERQCSVKAAANLVGELLPREKVINWDEVGRIVVDLADVFFEKGIRRKEDKPDA